MTSKNKRKKAKNSFCMNLNSIKNSYKIMKMKRRLFYTAKDRKPSKSFQLLAENYLTCGDAFTVHALEVRDFAEYLSKRL